MTSIQPLAAPRKERECEVHEKRGEGKREGKLGALAKNTNKNHVNSPIGKAIIASFFSTLTCQSMGFQFCIQKSFTASY